MTPEKPTTPDSDRTPKYDGAVPGPAAGQPEAPAEGSDPYAFEQHPSPRGTEPDPYGFDEPAQPQADHHRYSGQTGAGGSRTGAQGHYGQPAPQGPYAQQAPPNPYGQPGGPYAHPGSPYAHPGSPYAQGAPGYGHQVPPNPYAQSYYAPGYGVPKSRIVAGLLGIFLGGLGIHRFYLGYTNIGLVQLLVALAGGLVTFGIASFGVGIWGFVEGIMILCGARSFRTDARGIPLRD